ncbi:hypothetical protein CEXT_380261 [Caerostris extrusa]|uniref:Uncharacterized protein n=1 Tax=Caerostris extrusa TaxID=172846 RepID=A0AAV4XMU0_CAEEX|nr:hypothetical protein CEXT_380261 [Caerostris extrusa]
MRYKTPPAIKHQIYEAPPFHGLYSIFECSPKNESQPSDEYERTGECKRPAMCGMNYKEEYKRCYTEGGACEEKYKEQLLLAVNYTESGKDDLIFLTEFFLDLRIPSPFTKGF